MIKINNYSIEEMDNQLIITLPQLLNNATCTIFPYEKRKEKLETDELALILMLVKKMYEVSK